eukprot:Opistho-1_new@4378
MQQQQQQQQQYPGLLRSVAGDVSANHSVAQVAGGMAVPQFYATAHYGGPFLAGDAAQNSVHAQQQQYGRQAGGYPPTYAGTSPAGSNMSQQLLTRQTMVNQQHQQQSQEARKRGNGPVNNSLYKTELCHSFQETGFCKYKDKCQFAHGRNELRQLARHPKYKTSLCRTYHTIGTCPYGTRCHFIHSLDEMQVQVPSVAMHPVHLQMLQRQQQKLSQSQQVAAAVMVGGVADLTPQFGNMSLGGGRVPQAQNEQYYGAPGQQPPVYMPAAQGQPGGESIRRPQYASSSAPSFFPGAQSAGGMQYPPAQLAQNVLGGVGFAESAPPSLRSSPPRVDGLLPSKETSVFGYGSSAPSAQVHADLMYRGGSSSLWSESIVGSSPPSSAPAHYYGAVGDKEASPRDVSTSLRSSPSGRVVADSRDESRGGVMVAAYFSQPRLGPEGVSELSASPDIAERQRKFVLPNGHPSPTAEKLPAGASGVGAKDLSSERLAAPADDKALTGATEQSSSGASTASTKRLPIFHALAEPVV